MTVERPHRTTREKAAERVKAALAEYAEKFRRYNPRVSWLGPYEAETGIMGYSAKLEVTPDTVRISGSLPLMARPFAPMIEGEIVKAIEKAFP